MGLGFSGGELLLLAIGACHTNDIFREAVKRGVTVKNVQVDVECDWGGRTPPRAERDLLRQVEAKVTEAEIVDLIRHTGQVAEIHNSLRLGTPVSLVGTLAVSSKT